MAKIYDSGANYTPTLVKHYLNGIYPSPGLEYGHKYRKFNITKDSRASWIPSSIRPAWAKNISVDAQLYADGYITNEGHTYNQFMTSLDNSLKVVDTFSSIYSENVFTYLLPEGQNSSGPRGSIPGATNAQVAALQAVRDANSTKKLMCQSLFINSNDMLCPDRIVATLDLLNGLPFDWHTMFIKPDHVGYDQFTSPNFFTISSRTTTYDDYASLLDSMIDLNTRLEFFVGIGPQFLPGNISLGLTAIDWFDDAGWAHILSNIDNLSHAMANAGIQGFNFDLEDYTSNWANYYTSLYVGTKTLQEYRTQVQLRAKQMVETIIARLPDAKIVLVDSSIFGLDNSGSPEYSLYGSFYTGMVEACINSTKTSIAGGHLPPFPNIPFTPEVLNSRSNLTQSSFPAAYFILNNAPGNPGFGNFFPIQCITDFEYYLPDTSVLGDSNNPEYKFSELRKSLQRTVAGDKVIVGNYIESHYLADPIYFNEDNLYFPEKILNKSLFPDNECMKWDGDAGGLSGTVMTPYSPDYTDPTIRTKFLDYVEENLIKPRLTYGINFLLTDDWNVKQIPANTTSVWPVGLTGVLDYFEAFDNMLNSYNIAHCPNFGYWFTNYDHTPAPCNDSDIEFFASRAEMCICESFSNMRCVTTNQTQLLVPNSGDVAEFVRRHQLFIDNECMLNFLPLHFIWNADPYTDQKFLGTYAQIMGHTLVGWSELQVHREWTKYPKVFGSPVGNVQQIGPSGLILSREFEHGTLMLDTVSRCRTSGNFRDDVKMCMEEGLLYDVPTFNTQVVYSYSDFTFGYNRNNGSSAGIGGLWNDTLLDSIPVTISGSPDYGSCLVAPDIVLSSYSNHASGTIIFVDDIGQRIYRTITSGLRVGSTDIYVQRLDFELPTTPFANTNFNPAKVLPSNYASKIPDVSGIPVMMYDPNVNERKLFVGEWTAVSGGSVVVNQPPSGLYQNWYSPPSGNCTGSPCLIQLGEQLILLTLWSSFNGVNQSQGPSIADNITGINSAITTLGSTHQLSVALLEHNLY